MTDIVERLKSPREVCEHGSQRAKCPYCEVAELEADNARLRKILFTPMESNVCTISVSETDERRIEISVEYSASVPFWGRENFVADTIADCALLMLEEYSEGVRRALEGKDE